MHSSYLKKLITIALFVGSMQIKAQVKNVFLDRSFWKTNPTTATIDQKIKEGNNVSQANGANFDATVYAILENVDNKTIKHLLTKNGNGVNKLTHDGRTYIFWAAYKNNTKLVKHLINNGANTNILDDKGYSVLNFAAVGGVTNTKLYDLLIANGANLTKDVTPKGANALHLVAPNVDNFKVIDYFISKGLSITSTDNDGNTVFNYVAQKGNTKMLDLLIKKGVPYQSLNKNGGNAIIFATKGARRHTNSLNFFKYLEGLGISPNITTKNGTTPLHNLAYNNKDLASYNYFISKGVNTNQADKDGNTALLNAASRNSLEIIKLLVQKSDNINHTNNSGYSALTKAMRNSPEVIEFLLQKKAEVSVNDKKGYNLAYHLFKTYNDKNIVDFNKKLTLLEANGLKTAAINKNGSSLYHLAVEKNSTSMIQFIKKYAIDINTKNKDGLTPLQLAVMVGKNHELIKLLIAEGANTSVTTDFDETLYDLAKENEALKNTDINYLK